jgi:hypothetical protein
MDDRSNHYCISLLSEWRYLDLIDYTSFLYSVLRIDLDDNPLNLLKAKDDVEVDDSALLLLGSFSVLLLVSVVRISFADENAGSPVTTTFSNKGEVDVPAVVKSLVVLDFFNRSNGGFADLEAPTRS